MRHCVSAALLMLLLVGQAQAQGNGKLQIHYMDVGQGDAAIVVSPNGETVLIDDGVLNQCGKPMAYLQSLGLTKIDYFIASHYHSDHVGCAAQIFSMFPLQRRAYDRGGSYTTTAYSTYVTAVGAKRSTATPGMMLTLDATSATPVQILFVASNANGIANSDENDKSLVALVRFGEFEAVFGGDLGGAGTGVMDPDSGEPVIIQPTGGTCARPAGAPANSTAVCKDGTFSASQNRSGTCSSHSGVQCWICPGVLCTAMVSGAGSAPPPDTEELEERLRRASNSYVDIETSVAPAVGQVEVYKVNHHGSASSSNAAWMNTTRPRVGIISVGSANSYGHPTAAALSRVHSVGTHTYWTSTGNGAAPITGLDVIAGDVVVEVGRLASSFSVRYSGRSDTYAMWGFSLPARPVGVIDTPAPSATVAGEVAVTGWAIDDGGIAGVDIYRSPLPGEAASPNGLVFIGTATQIEGARPDVVNAYPQYPGVTRAGWGLMVLSNFLPNGGNGIVTLHAIARSLDGESFAFASRTIVSSNTNSSLPFGTIDTPGQGGTVSGMVTNFGWALTPNPKMIPTNGSTIDVYIDGVLAGHPSYGHYRADIATLFPGYANSNGAVGFFQFDSTTLANGLHTIGWSVRDSGGKVQGIGSRYFRVQNP